MPLVDQTSSTILSYLYHMATHPLIQRKVQEELDETSGRGHIPSIDDCLGMKYLEATWKESLRMAPPVPLGKLFLIIAKVILTDV